MEKWLKRELFWNQVMFVLIRGMLYAGLVLMTLVFVVLTGAIAVEGFSAPTLVGGERRAETLTYGLLALALVSVLTKNGLFRAWRGALQQLREAHAGHVASIHRACRCSPEYYR